MNPYEYTRIQQTMKLTSTCSKLSIDYENRVKVLGSLSFLVRLNHTNKNMKTKLSPTIVLTLLQSSPDRMLSLARSRRQGGNRRRTHHTQREYPTSRASGHVERANSSHRPDSASESRNGDRPNGGEWRKYASRRPRYHGSLRYPAERHVGGRSLTSSTPLPDRAGLDPARMKQLPETRPNDPWLVVSFQRGS